jgi:outer membrane protein
MLLLACAILVRAEIHTMSFRQALEAGARQNPEIVLARLDEEKARHAVQVARDPFLPRLVVGSGLAYSNGFPMSIEGSAPSVVQAQAIQYIFNRPQSLLVAQAREGVRSAALGVAGKREEVVYRVAALFLDAERAARAGSLARRDIESLDKVLGVVRAQVAEGRALPLAEKTAAFQVASARQLASSLEADQASAETALALALGFSAADRVRPVDEQRPSPVLPLSEEEAIESAIELNKDLRRLESQITSKQLEIRATRAERLPRADLVAQYGMLARFNNYEDFFRKFQRHNGQIGVSFQLPIMAGPGVGARIAQSQTDVTRLKMELSNTRNRLSSDIQQSFRDLKKAESAAEVARLDLEVAREQLSVNLAQMQEGRVTLRQVEEARIIENHKWIAFYDAQYAVEKAQWNVLRLTGNLLAAIGDKPADRN